MSNSTFLQVHNDDEVRTLFKQVQGEVPGSPIFIMRLAAQVGPFMEVTPFPLMLSYSGVIMVMFCMFDL
jgi:hypothetical protein